MKSTFPVPFRAYFKRRRGVVKVLPDCLLNERHDSMALTLLSWCVLTHSHGPRVAHQQMWHDAETTGHRAGHTSHRLTGSAPASESACAFVHSDSQCVPAPPGASREACGLQDRAEDQGKKGTDCLVERKAPSTL